MKLTEKQQSRADLVEAIIRRTWEDATFKRNLINNPLPTIKEFTGKTLDIPAGKSLVVEDQTDANIIYLNIPAEPNLDDLELTDEQLALVAGGATPTTVILLTACFLTGVGIGIASS